MAIPLEGDADVPARIRRSREMVSPTRSVGRVGAEQAAEESRLIREAQAGNRPAFDELVRRYDRDVLRVALRIMRSPEDARDIYQEAFLKAYRNLPRFRFECSFYTWMYRIVTNVCLDQLRRRNTRREEQAPAGALGTPGASSAAGGLGTADDTGGSAFFERQPEGRPEANPERSLLGKEIGRQISRALEGLSPRERMVFEMKHYEGMKLRAIGEILGTSEETVKNSLFRATQKMRAQLDGLLEGKENR